MKLYTMSDDLDSRSIYWSKSLQECVDRINQYFYSFTVPSITRFTVIELDCSSLVEKKIGFVDCSDKVFHFIYDD